jgi:hypothetical protein
MDKVNKFAHRISDNANNKQDVLMDIVFFLEDEEVDPSKKQAIIRLLSEIASQFSTTEFATFLWVIGKFHDQLSVDLLRNNAQRVIETKDSDVGRQFLISYENIIGNEIGDQDKKIFLYLRDIALNDERIAKILPRFHAAE